MNKEVAARLNKIAERLPKLFMEHKDIVKMKGSELLLTPAADQYVIINPEGWYDIEIPKYVAVEHKQQLKDAYKRGGWKAVDLYGLEILYYSGCLEGVDVVAMIKAKNRKAPDGMEGRIVSIKEAAEKKLGNIKQ